MEAKAGRGPVETEEEEEEEEEAEEDEEEEEDFFLLLPCPFFFLPLFFCFELPLHNSGLGARINRVFSPNPRQTHTNKQCPTECVTVVWP